MGVRRALARFITAFVVFLPLIFGGGEMPILPGGDELFQDGYFVALDRDSRALPPSELSYFEVTLRLPKQFQTASPVFSVTAPDGNAVLSLNIFDAPLGGTWSSFASLSNETVVLFGDGLRTGNLSIDVSAFPADHFMEARFTRNGDNVNDTLTKNIVFIGWLFE